MGKYKELYCDVKHSNETDDLDYQYQEYKKLMEEYEYRYRYIDDYNGGIGYVYCKGEDKYFVADNSNKVLVFD